MGFLLYALDFFKHTNNLKHNTLFLHPHNNSVEHGSKGSSAVLGFIKIGGHEEKKHERKHYKPILDKKGLRPYSTPILNDQTMIPEEKKDL